ncbi:MAG: PH domain-containing protein [Oscillospiraceae bacterium]|jgi:hypothetical protein|nr:PH domain-containing protein [Oscillospiraceae bacterium]MCI2190940.1 PH domain-containing protein [Oscillospiraceae bacterium]MCI2205924.1 PH domain-containing protein [Oscillospiraceae bacterium]
MFGKNNGQPKQSEQPKQSQQVGIINNDADFIPMHTAEEMYNYCIAHKFGSGTVKSWGIKHFKIVEDNLMKNETVYMTFIGLHNYKSSSKHDGNFAYAVTDKRIIMAQKRAIGQNFQTVNISNINDITFKSGLLMGVLTIDTYKEVFNVGLNKVEAGNINSAIHIVLDKIKSDSSQPVTQGEPKITEVVPSAADELLKYKSLLDAGAINQEEYDTKKKQLLGL